MKINKTNAARLLNRAGIPYELVPYEVDEEHGAASHVAAQLREDIAQVLNEGVFPIGYSRETSETVNKINIAVI